MKRSRRAALGGKWVAMERGLFKRWHGWPFRWPKPGSGVRKSLAVAEGRRS